MKFIDLFAGIGGFRLGMEMAAHECVGFCEIDKFAEKSYRAMHDTEGEWFADDIRTVDPRDIPEFDCITGGFPCQSFSVAGKRGGFEDTRGTLFFEIARIIRERQPKLVFLENVKGLLNHDGGRTFGTILQTFWELGYDVEWQLLNSKDFGVPQNRERVFIIGYPRGTRRRKIFPIRETDKKISRDIKRVASSEYYRRSYQTYDINGSVEALDTMQGGGRQPHIKVIDKKGNLKQGNTRGQYASTLTGGGNSGGNHSDMDLIVQKEVMISEATKKGYDIATEGDSINLAVPGSKTRRGRVGKGVANTLDTSCNQGVIQRVDIPQKVTVRKYEVDTNKLVEILRNSKEKTKITNREIAEILEMPITKIEHWFRTDNSFSIPDAKIWLKLKEILDIRTNEFDKSILTFEEREGVFEKANRCYKVEGIAPTLTNTSADEKILDGLIIRRLTPRECFRLQGFPDEYFDRAREVNSDSQLYKQVGNSVTVNVIYEIARRF